VIAKCGVKEDVDVEEKKNKTREEEVGRLDPKTTLNAKRGASFTAIVERKGYHVTSKPNSKRLARLLM